MKQRNRKLACLCITTALLATANTTTAVARESKDQVVRQENCTLHTGAAALAVDAAKADVLRIVKESKKADVQAEKVIPEEEVLEEIVPGPCEEQAQELAVAQVNSYINVRNQPGLEGEIIGKLHNNAVGEIVGEEGEWLKISSGSVEGYIKSEYALRGEEGAKKAEEVGERHAKVEAVTLRLREEATTESKTVELLPQEEVLLVQQEEEGWVKVASQDTQGYVSAEYVEVYTVHQVAESKEEEEARLRKEEEERRAAEEAARAAEEAARAEEARKTATSRGQGAGTSANTPAGNLQMGSSTPSSTKENIPAASASLGQSIANYALQFVGNPYVYGGTSLTNGADCSGFVMSVYKYFGIQLPRTSGEQGKCGQNVGGISNAQPGDLVSYSGHIGIYIGNGQIVHASSAKTGIKVSNASYRTILSVRRIV